MEMPTYSAPEELDTEFGAFRHSQRFEISFVLPTMALNCLLFRALVGQSVPRTHLSVLI